MKTSINRRKAIQISLQTGLILPFLGSSLLSCKESEKNKSFTPVKLKILILGGTSFLGPHQVAYALGRGHEVTTFTRGKTEPTIYKDLFKQVTSLVGDRSNDLKALETGTWDLVINNSGREIKWAKDSAQLLKDRAKMYLYTSSTGVYYPYLGEEINERKIPLTEEPTSYDAEYEKMEYWYAVMKGNSEREVIKAFGEDRSIIVRPTYMIGPADKSDRFIHWPIRLPKGGDLIIPGKKEDRVQYIDVRDVAEWMIRLGEEKQAGIFNAVGPSSNETLLEFAQKTQQVFPVESKLVHIDDYQFLEDNDIYYLVPWILPTGKNYATARISNAKAKLAGLSYRDLATSIKDTHDWWYSDAISDKRRAKYTDKENTILFKEAELLAKWRDFKRKNK